MKKLLIITLTLALVLALAACNQPAEYDPDTAIDADGNVLEVETTPTDLISDEEYLADPSDTAENETFITDYSLAAARLGLADLSFPEEMQLYRVLLVDEDKVQVEFYCNDKYYLGQYVVGLAENPSGLKGLFAKSESVTLSDENVTLEYPDPEQASGKQMALAQTYNADTNVTSWLADNNFTDLEEFKSVTALFLDALD